MGAVQDALERFEQTADARPEAIALRSGGLSLTYGELDGSAERLARLLRDSGVGPEVVVGACVSRGPAAVVSMLAVMKAGGAYLPLDRTLPPARLAAILEIASPALVVADGTSRAALPETPCPVLAYEALRHAALGERLPRSTAPDSLSYIVFTSGSTGDPKGIELPRRTLDHLVEWSLALNPRPRNCTQLASVGFDVSIQEVFVTLAGGGTLTVVPEECRKDPRALLALLSEAAVVSVHMPPAMLGQLAQAWAEEPCELSLSQLYLAGEAVRFTPEVRRFLASLGGVLVQNEYGMSEAQVVTRYPMTGRPQSWPQYPPIGDVVPGASVYLLDERLRQVSPGGRGELYVGGVSVGRAYRRRPDLTAGRFVADPFADDPGAVMYRTGDLGVLQHDGSIEFHGRADGQISVRGFRVETGEIDAVLAQHPRVAQAVTILREDRPGDQRLVAYLTERDGGVPADDIRHHAAERLPEYMVPSAFVVLESLPLNANGKVDRRALPRPAVTSARRRAPRTPQQEMLCELFAQVLGVPVVGIDDEFKALGGHSLLATKLVARIRATFGVVPSVRSVLEAGTVARLASLLATAADAPPALEPRERPAGLPLSFSQLRLWFIDRLEGGGSAYHVRISLRITGPLDEAALRAALADLVGRHEVLRTVYADTADGPRQRILPAGEAGVALRTLQTDEDRLDEELRSAAEHPFDLSVESPLAATLMRTGPDTGVLLLVAHHIAVDGWSLGPLLDDLGTAYAARRQGRPPGWEPLAVQYADFALWQHEVYGGDGETSPLRRQSAYWRHVLEGLPERITLPCDRPRPPRRSGEAGSTPIRIDAATHAAVSGLAEQTDTTVFMVLHAVLAVLLFRMGAGPDVPLGVPVAGRHDPALDASIGCFVNTLVLRTDLSGDPTFRELLRTVRESDLAAFAHQDLPFERVVDMVGPTRSLSHHPLFQVLLAFNNTVHVAPRLDGLRVEPVEVPDTQAKMDLAFLLRETRDDDGCPAGVLGTLVYARDIFDQETADGLAARLRQLLNAFVADPDQPVTRPECVLTAEREWLLVACNGQRKAVPETTLPALITEQAHRTPHRRAVTDGTTALTYAELEAAADRVAAAVAGRGAGPEQRIAVALPRSADLVAALLGVLKAGAAYVVIEPDQPPERLRLLLEEAEPLLTITGDRAIETVHALGVPRLPIAQALSRPAYGAGAVRGGLAAPLPRHPAYLLFTSGSSGKPKGVIVEHRALACYVVRAREAYPDAAESTVLHSPPSFDLTVTALWTPLVSGGCVHVAELDGSGPRPGLLKVTPSHLELMRAARADPAPSGTLIIGGEALHGEQLARWRTGHPDVTVINAYGPTEATVNCTEYRLPPGAPTPSGPVPIGRPFRNTRAYVLDSALRLLPPGVPGELYVSGPGLARGYWKQPALTAERFVSDPFGQPGARMYRTGDLVLRLRDGDLVYLGRTDAQVKVRGFRVEPGEIEAVAASHPDVVRAVVAVRETAQGDRSLVGYVTSAPGRSAPPAGVREYLAARLPAHLVPADVVVLPELPLTRNGKVDRERLPAPAAPRSAPYRPARSEREEVLCAAFADLLDVPRVGIDDSFFALGGHSLLGARLILRLRTVLGSSLSLRDLFEAPTVAGLAARLDTGTSTSGLGTLLPIRPSGSLPGLFCVHPVTGVSWCYARLAAHLATDRPIHGLQSPRLSNSAAAPKDVEHLAAQYVQLLRTVQPKGPYHLLGWSFGGLVAHEMAAQLEQSDGSVGSLTMLDSHLPGASVDDITGATDRRALLRAYGVALVEIEDEVVDSVYGAMVEHKRLEAGFVPKVYSGALLFYGAARQRPAHWQGAQQWRPYVTGQIDERTVPCRHLEMTEPRYLALIARSLNRRLAG